MKWALASSAAIAAWFLVAPAWLHAATESRPRGLLLTVSAGGKSHQRTVSTVGLSVRAGEAANPFVPAGPFTAVWSGHMHAELRGSVTFKAELAGVCELEINGRPVFSAGSSSGPPAVARSGLVALSKGANPVVIRFQSARTADSFLRLGWSERGTNFSPIPMSALSHEPTPALARDQELAEARALFFDRRCVACHAVATGAGPASPPELTMDAPALAGLGRRRHVAWLRDWVLDPRVHRPSARMPKLLSGPNAGAEAEAIAAYLGSLTNDAARAEVAAAPVPYRTRSGGDRATAGTAGARETRPLYERLQCGVCHHAPGEAKPDPQKISHQNLRAKYPAGQLAEYLLAPEAGHAWTRMPNFHLTREEATELETFLAASAPGSTASPAGPSAAVDGPSAGQRVDPGTIARGERLVRAKGCRQCHEPAQERARLAPSLGEMARVGAISEGASASGCLGSAPRVDFGFSSAEKAKLHRLLREAADAIGRHVPSEFAERQVRELACMACHGAVELVPTIELLGGKLKPEWSAQFMAGKIRRKMRYDQHPSGEPWLAARMPAFRSRAEALAVGLAAQHGYPARTPAEPPADPVAAGHGRVLVGKTGGFSCVSCHAVGPYPALEVFESEGINLAESAGRLQPSYYRRWFRNPLAIDPQTKMPVYFDDEGGSPLTEVLNGDGAAQIEAVWHYLRLCERLPKPD